MDKTKFSTHLFRPSSLLIPVLSVVLASVALSASALPEQSEAEKYRTAREVTQKWIQFGAEQLQQGAYQQAEKSLLFAQDYQEYLTAAERVGLTELLGKARIAAQAQQTTSPADNAAKLKTSLPAIDKAGSVSSADRKTTILQNHTSVVVNHALAKAQHHLNTDNPDKARETLQMAERTVARNHSYLGETAFSRYTARLRQLNKQITHRQNAKALQLQQQKRLQAENKPWWTGQPDASTSKYNPANPAQPPHETAATSIDPKNTNLSGRPNKKSAVSLGLPEEVFFGEAIDKLKNSVDPPLKIVVMWRDLAENADIEPTTLIHMDPVSGIKLRTVLELLLEAASDGTAELGYLIEDGIIKIATKDSLKSKSKTVVYDFSELAAPSTGFGNGGYGGYGGMGMMGGSGYGGSRGGYGGYGNNMRSGYGGGRGMYGNTFGGYGGGYSNRGRQSYDSRRGYRSNRNRQKGRYRSPGGYYGR